MIYFFTLDNLIQLYLILKKTLTNTTVLKITRQIENVIILGGIGESILGIGALEKIDLGLNADQFHEIKGVLRIVNLVITQLQAQTIRNKLNITRHEIRIHADEAAGKGLRDEFLLNLRGLLDNLVDAFFVEFLVQLAI